MPRDESICSLRRQARRQVFFSDSSYRAIMAQPAAKGECAERAAVSAGFAGAVCATNGSGRPISRAKLEQRSRPYENRQLRSDLVAVEDPLGAVGSTVHF